MGAPDDSSSRSPRASGRPSSHKGGKPGRTSAGKPGRAPAGKPGRAPAGKPGRAPAGKPGSPRSSKPKEMRSSKPRETRADDDRPRGPRIPDGITGKEIDRRVAAELRTLPEGLAEQVARLLVAASATIDEDPQAALVFAKEAKRKAARVAPVREAVGVAAYAAGDYAEALSEFRALRRMTGDASYVPVMADCERGLGRPRKALELLSTVSEGSLPPDARIEARIVSAGARRDLGQPEAALLILQGPDLTARRTEPWLARLRYAYADTLLELGRGDEAATWFERAMDVDTDGQTDAADRLAELQGVTFGEDWVDGEVSSD